MMSRVFVTGLGAITATGKNVNETWDALIAGKNGIGPIEQWDMSDSAYGLAAEIKDLNPKQLIKNRKLLKLISRADVLGIHAAGQAIDDSGILNFRDGLADSTAFNDNTGIYVGSPGNKFYQQYDFLPLLAKSKGDMKAFANHLFEEVHPMWLLKILPNNVLAYVGIEYGFKGANQNITNHVASGLQALSEAYKAIANQQLERVVVVAYDLGFEPQAVQNYAKLGILSQRGLNPFDVSHDGTIFAEAAAAMVLESEEAMNARGAEPLAEVIGAYTSSDAMGIFSIEKEGAVFSDALTTILSDAKLSSDDIGMITAHGNGNPQSDISESQAIYHQVKNTTPVTSFKWSVGHSLSASGLLDSVLTVRSLNKSVVPGIANFNELATDCAPINISRETSRLKSPLAMVLSRGFGGINGAVLLTSAVN